MKFNSEKPSIIENYFHKAIGISKVILVSIVICSLFTSCYYYRKKKNPIIVPNNKFLREYGNIVEQKRIRDEKEESKKKSYDERNLEDGRVSLMRTALINESGDEILPFDFDQEIYIVREMENKDIKPNYTAENLGPFLTEDDIKFDDMEVPFIGVESKGKKFKDKDYIIVNREDFQNSVDNLVVQRTKKVERQNKVFEINKQIQEEEKRKAAEKKRREEEADKEEKGVFSTIKDIISGATEEITGIFK